MVQSKSSSVCDREMERLPVVAGGVAATQPENAAERRGGVTLPHPNVHTAVEEDDTREQP